MDLTGNFKERKCKSGNGFKDLYQSIFFKIFH